MLRFLPSLFVQLKLQPYYILESFCPYSLTALIQEKKEIELWRENIAHFFLSAPKIWR